ncbi:MAG: hypothetical protein KGR26_01870 [Cyanobacteria bacterium REEB65]|nr:hypothetical protein [Cyanobacteria bacterium REEB65]
MGSDLRYSLINTFSAIDAWRQNIVFNLQGAATPGFNKLDTDLNLFSSLNQYRAPIASGANSGGVPQVASGPSELRVAPSTFEFVQGSVGQAAGQLTSLAINGNGFFAVAESLQPGARVFLTREGDFSWGDTTPPNQKKSGFQQFNLQTKQGLYVLRAQDIDLNPNSPTFMTVKSNDPPPGIMVSSADQRDGTLIGPPGSTVPDHVRGVIGFTGNPFNMSSQEKADPLNNNSDIAIVRVPMQEFLQPSAYGATVYETDVATRAGLIGKSYAQWVQSGDPIQVQSESIEQPDFTTIEEQANIDSDIANFVFKNLRDMLDNYNKSLDDLLGLIH